MRETRRSLLIELRRQRFTTQSVPAPPEPAQPVPVQPDPARAETAQSRPPHSRIPDTGEAAAHTAPAPAPPARTRARRDLSQLAVRNLLLIFGGLLIAAAAIVFAIVSWGHPGLRAGILIGVTLVALASPWPLTRLRLGATAETVALIGLVLLPLDGIAIVMAVSRPQAEGDPPPAEVVLGTAAISAALLAVGWALYGRYAPLRLVRPTAIILAQFSLPLGALAAGAETTGLAAALCGTAAFDLLLARRSNPTARVASAITGGTGTALALIASVTPISAAALPTSGVLIFAATLTTAHNRRIVTPRRDSATARNLVQGIAGICLIAALASPLKALLPAGWTIIAYVGAAVAVLASVPWLPARLRYGMTAAGGGTLAVTGLIALPDALTAITPPLNWVNRYWSGAPPRTYGFSEAAWTGSPSAPLVMLAIAAVALVMSRQARPGLARRSQRTGSLSVSLISGTIGALAIPVMADLPYVAAVAVPVGVAVLMLAVASFARDDVVAAMATAASFLAVILASSWASVETGPMVVIHAVLLVPLAGSAIVARTQIPRCAAAAAVLLTACVAIMATREAEISDGFVTSAELALRAIALLAVLPVRPGAAWWARRPAQVRAFDAAAAPIILVALFHAPSPEGLALALAAAALLTAGAAWARGSRGKGRRRWSDVRVGVTWLFAFCAPLPLGDAFLSALTGPYAWAAHAWEGNPGDARTALAPGTSGWDAEPALMPVLVLAGAAAVLATWRLAGRWAALGVTRALLPIVLAPLPLAAGVPYWAAIAFLLALTAALAVWARRSGGPAGVAVLWIASLTVVWSLATRPATLIVFAVLAVISGAIALRARRAPEASAGAALATLALGAEGGAIALISGLDPRYAAFVVLVIGAMSLRAGVALPPPARIAVQSAGALLLLTATGMAASSSEPLALALAISGAAAVASAGHTRPIGVLAAGWLAGALALLLVLQGVVAAVWAPYESAGAAWTARANWQQAGCWPNLASSIAECGSWSLSPVAGPVVAIVAGTVIGSARVLGGVRATVIAATIAVPVAMLMLPPGLGFSYPQTVALLSGLAVALSVQAARSRGAIAITAGAMALWVTTLVVAWSLADRIPTVAVLAGVTVLAAGAAAIARAGSVRAGASAAGTLAAGGLAFAAPLAVDVPVRHSAFATLAVAGLAQLIAAEARHRHREVALAVEISGYAVAAAGLVLACGAGRPASLAFGCAGTLLLAVALRRDRRPAALAGGVLVQLALWTALATYGVEAPEAYTVTLSAAGLAVGLWSRRSSWMAYGPALGVTFAPSLVVLLADGSGVVRPSLLAGAALAATLAGARFRLQAPLLIGCGILLLSAGDQLGPALVGYAGSGPRWVPIAVTGVALLFTGATYEHRLRDLRRLRRRIVGMR